MGNSIKYSEGSESLALNKGNWWIGTGDTNKGPTAESGYWNAINPPSGGYTVYLNKESNGPSIHSISNDEHLISFTNKISGNNYVNVAECLVYYQTQDDKLCVNREYENIVTDGLVLNLDAGYAPSYPTSGTTWYDLSGNGNDGTLINGPIYSGGSMVFDGVNDWVSFPNNSKSLIQGQTNFTIGITFQSNTNLVLRSLFGTLRYGCGRNIGLVSSFNNLVFYNDYGPSDSGTCYAIGFNNYVTPNTWIYTVATYDGITTRLYAIKNNILSTSAGTTKSGPSNVFDYNLEIGRGGFGQYLTGNIANAFIYNRTLSSEEVLQNYNALKGRFGL